VSVHFIWNHQIVPFLLYPTQAKLEGVSKYFQSLLASNKKEREARFILQDLFQLDAEIVTTTIHRMNNGSQLRWFHEMDTHIWEDKCVTLRNMADHYEDFVVSHSLEFVCETVDKIATKDEDQKKDEEQTKETKKKEVMMK